jgi:hypothetical protein
LAGDDWFFGSHPAPVIGLSESKTLLALTAAKLEFSSPSYLLLASC